MFADFTPGEDVPDARTERGRRRGSPVGSCTGAEPAVYGGSRDTQVCDVGRLVAFLTDPANAAKAEAWADVLGVERRRDPDLRRRR